MKPMSTIKKLKAGEAVRIAAIGDSLTYGWMVSRGYLGYLQDMIAAQYPGAKFSIINAGIPGDTAEGGMHRIEYDVISRNPDCVLIQFALNDAFAGYPPPEFESNVRSMIDRVRSSSRADMILLTSVCLNDEREDRFIDQYYGRLENLAEEYSLPLAAVHKYWREKISGGVQFGRLVQYDMVHPTEAGYKLMAEAVMEVFID
ncbi:MAG: GDSL-type esterase/lipase family protein [Syntrophales bacterium]|nr:GDSL-type esterase/lipase family protein [Syntrophales bacterium]MDD5233281.1 GDSL-type esterase/lipase family protein [Syntrophales bacterium]